MTAIKDYQGLYRVILGLNNGIDLKVYELIPDNKTIK